jgi:hypothetical protein
VIVSRDLRLLIFTRYLLSNEIKVFETMSAESQRVTKISAL